MTAPAGPSQANVAVVRDFFEALAARDLDRATSLLAPDVEWRNTGLPTFHGKRVHAMVRDLERRGIGFALEMHAIGGEVDTVLTDRTDYLSKGPLRTSFRVRGTFVVRDGLITLWDDAFSMAGALLGLLRRGRG